MMIEQIYTSCLAQATYYIESNGEVAIIDPLRDYQTYIEKAKNNGAKIKYVFESHFHADFVSGHIDLAKETGAEIVYGPNANTGYKVCVAQDGQVFKLGKISIQVIHTPGHTLESSCFLLTDENGKAHAVFTGDTLFVGDVGRPDLLDGIITKEELASMLFESLKKLSVLPDDVIVYPAHGAGSACGKNIGKETFSTIGAQKANNYALKITDKNEFVSTVCSGISPAPAYFFKDATLNKNGYSEYNAIVKNGMNTLSLENFQNEIANGAVVIDSRIPDFFELGFIPGSINLGLNGQFAIWAATILDIHQPVVLICKPGTEEETITRLSRVGFDQIKGFLDGGFDTWLNADKKYDMVISISSEEFALDAKHNPNAMIIDVRKPSEFKDGHVKKAKNIPLDQLLNHVEDLDKNAECLIHCAGGYRSMMAASLFKKHGFKNIKNVWGGYAQIKEEEKIEIE
jgi:glyoxylase-like metal-dependent hydrolase (beta-lactamase superfamily II)/rhodanese-related sulfurtransferase